MLEICVKVNGTPILSRLKAVVSRSFFDEIRIISFHKATKREAQIFFQNVHD